MKTAILVYVVFVSLMQSFQLHQQCNGPLLYSQDCTWYIKCLQERYHCGETGYPQSFGFKYCTKFSQLKNTSDPIVMKWLEDVTVCLKESLKNFVEDETEYTDKQANAKICSKIQSQAFESHPVCYEKAGFCKIWKELGVVGSAKFAEELVSTYEIRDFMKYRALKQIAELYKRCQKEHEEAML